MIRERISPLFDGKLFVRCIINTAQERTRKPSNNNNNNNNNNNRDVQRQLLLTVEFDDVVE
jgi:hypothetical protein